MGELTLVSPTTVHGDDPPQRGLVACCFVVLLIVMLIHKCGALSETAAGAHRRQDHGETQVTDYVEPFEACDITHVDPPPTPARPSSPRAFTSRNPFFDMVQQWYNGQQQQQQYSQPYQAASQSQPVGQYGGAYEAAQRKSAAKDSPHKTAAPARTARTSTRWS